MKFWKWKIWRTIIQFLKSRKNRELIFAIVSLIKENKRIKSFSASHYENTTSIEVEWENN